MSERPIEKRHRGDVFARAMLWRRGWRRGAANGAPDNCSDVDYIRGFADGLTARIEAAALFFAQIGYDPKAKRPEPTEPPGAPPGGGEAP